MENIVFSQATRGIELLNSDVQWVSGNTIEGLSTTLYSVGVFGHTYPNYGIRVVNGDAHVENNTVSTSSPTTKLKVYGMSFETYHSGLVTCNDIINVGTGIHYGGVQSAGYTSLYSNTMDDNHNGLVLTNGSELSAIGYSGYPSDNQWTGTFTGYHTYTDGADGNYTTLWTRSGGLPYEPQVNGSNNGPPTPISINSTSGTGYVCQSALMGSPGEPVNSAYTPSSNPSLSDTVGWLEDYQLYKTIENDSLSNVTLQAFKDSVDNTLLGKAVKVKKNMHNNSISDQQKLANLNLHPAANHMEANLKEVLEIELASSGWDTLPSAAENSLLDLAEACPFVEGPAVHWARGILFSFNGESYINDCEMYDMGNASFSRIKNPVIEKENEITVFPNPTKDNFNVNLELEEDKNAKIIVYDVSGKELLNINLNDGVNNINTTHFEPSVYYYYIIVDNVIKRTGKLIIL